MSLCDLLLPYIPYQHAIHAIACEIVGDNELVINWLNGIALTNDKQHQAVIEMITTELNNSWQAGAIASKS